MTLLALDLGTKTGYAVGTPGAIVSSTQHNERGRFDGGGMRFLRFRRWLNDLHHTTRFGEVVFEEVRGHEGTDAAHVYGGLLAVLTAWCEEKQIPYTGIPVGTIKRFATGKGNASKTDVIAAVQGWGYKPKDDNEADAIALFHYRTTEKGMLD